MKQMTEHRTRVEIKYEPEGPEMPGPVNSFQLVRTEIHETRRRESDRWQYASQNRTVVADGITRRMLSAMIADGADWLSYIEGAGGWAMRTTAEIPCPERHPEHRSACICVAHTQGDHRDEHGCTWPNAADVPVTIELDGAGQPVQASSGPDWVWPTPSQSLGADNAPHCRAHIQFRSDCAACRSERESS